MLGSAEIDEFFENGYLIRRGVFDAAEVAAMVDGFERLEARAATLAETAEVDGSLFVIHRSAGKLRIERIVWCGGAEPVLGRLGRTKALTLPAMQLLGGPEMDQLINQAHIKNPGDGLSFHYHQDSYHRRFGTDLFHDVNGTGSFVQTITAVDAMSPENGGLWVVPGSHRLRHIPTADGHLPAGCFDESAAVPVLLAAGDAVLFSPFTVHGSGLNTGSTPRRVLINGFASPGANRRVYPGAGRGLRLNALDQAA